MNHRLLLLPVVLSLASGCLSGPDSGEPDPSVPDPGGPDPGGLALPFTFTDVTEEMGITNHFHSGTPEKRYIMEAKGLSGAFFDYDGDGNLDLYILNGSRVGEPPDGDVRTNMLYRTAGKQLLTLQELEQFRLLWRCPQKWELPKLIISILRGLKVLMFT